MTASDLDAFLAPPDGDYAAYAQARAAAVDLTIPPPCRDGVVDNLTLLASQTALLLAGLAAAQP